MEHPKHKKTPRILALILVIALTIAIFLLHDRIPNLQAYGLPGIFFLSLLTNATLILPVPGVVITSTMSAIFHPFLVALAAGTGAAIGELTGYLAGFSGQIVIENRPRFSRLVEWMKKYGGWTILVLSIIPNPAFDMAGIVAGALKYPVHKFLSWCWLGKVIKMLMFAYAGAGIFSWLEHLFTR